MLLEGKVIHVSKHALIARGKKLVQELFTVRSSNSQPPKGDPYPMHGSRESVRISLQFTESPKSKGEKGLFPKNEDHFIQNLQLHVMQHWGRKRFINTPSFTQVGIENKPTEWIGDLLKHGASKKRYEDPRNLQTELPSRYSWVSDL